MLEAGTQLILFFQPQWQIFSNTNTTNSEKDSIPQNIDYVIITHLHYYYLLLFQEA